MERNDIIKALECCCGIRECRDCPYTEIDDCAKQNTKDVISLIKQLTEENERLKEKADRYRDNLKAVLKERNEDTE